MPTFTPMLLTIGHNRPGEKLSRVDFVVIHWTANFNRGAGAVANRDYFENNPEVKASAHYIVDDKQIIQCIPEDEVAWHSGNAEVNHSSLSIEWCVNVDAKGAEVYRNVVGLVGDILTRHGLPSNAARRHSDIVATECPGFFTTDAHAQRFGWPSAAVAWKVFLRDLRIAARACEVAKGVRNV